MGAQESMPEGLVDPEDKVLPDDDGRYHRLVAGVDLSDRHLSVGLVDEHGAFYGSPKDVTAIGGVGISAVWWEHLGDFRAPAAVAQRIAGLLRLALNEMNRPVSDLQAIGVSVAGVIDVKSGVVNSSGCLKDWKNVPLCSMIAEELSYENLICLETGPNAMLLAETFVGTCKGVDNVVLLTLGDEEVGGAILCDGGLLRGNTGRTAKIGDTILVPDGRSHGTSRVKGSLNAYVSSSAVVGCALENGGPPAESALSSSPKPLECAEVFKQAEAGDEFALKLAKETARHLAVGLINCCRFVDPDLIFLQADSMAKSGEFMIKEVREQFAAHYWNIEPVRVRIRGTSVGIHAGVLGAAKAALQTIPSDQ